jgi:methylated-DNA-[protein]-cysteine S-methyltransferase
MTVFFYQTAIGNIGIAETGGFITNLFINFRPAAQDFETAETPVISEAARQLNDYLAGNLRKFSLPLDVKGTKYTLSVLGQIKEIPYGETASYRKIALILGNKNAARAVGLACGKNPLPIIIPCHRVIAGNGTLGGYLGGQTLKKKLLYLESAGQKLF